MRWPRALHLSWGEQQCGTARVLTSNTHTLSSLYVNVHPACLRAGLRPYAGTKWVQIAESQLLWSSTKQEGWIVLSDFSALFALCGCSGLAQLNSKNVRCLQSINHCLGYSFFLHLLDSSRIEAVAHNLRWLYLDQWASPCPPVCLPSYKCHRIIES